MELTLDEKSRLIFRWLDTGQLSIERWTWGTDKHGHGLLYQGRHVLSDEQLHDLCSFLANGQQHETEAA